MIYITQIFVFFFLLFLDPGEKGLQVYLIFEYCHHDLTGLIQNKSIAFTLPHIKHFLKELLEAVQYIHCHCNLLHRDIKCKKFFCVCSLCFHVKWY